VAATGEDRAGVSVGGRAVVEQGRAEGADQEQQAAHEEERAAHSADDDGLHRP